MASDDETNIEVTRYPKGSDLLFSGGLPLATAGHLPYAVRVMLAILCNPLRSLRLLWPPGRARNNVALLVMQTADTFVHIVSKRVAWMPWYRWSVEQHAGDKPLHTSFPSAEQSARLFAEEMGGTAGQSLPGATGRPITAHPLGGAPMGADRTSGVVDERGEVFGYKNLQILDASIIPSNLGVNPSLTILALAEYSMSKFPVYNRERAIKQKPILFSRPMPGSASTVNASGDLLEVAKKLQRQGTPGA